MSAILSEIDPASLQAKSLRPVWLRVGWLFDGEQVVRDAHLVYDDLAIRHAGAASPPATAIRSGQDEPDLHLPGSTILPGLIESHAHLFLEGGEKRPDVRARQFTRTDSELLADAERRLPRILRLGVTAIRDAGDRNGVGLALQRRYRMHSPTTVPYLDSPGAAIHHRGRYGAFMGRAVEDDGSLDRAIAARVGDGAHRIKLLATGIINFEKGAVTAKPQMPAEELLRAVSLARAHGRQTFAHCSGADGVDNCLAAGVDSIEHGFFVNEEQLARMRDRDIAWVPTFAPVQFQLDHAAALGWDTRVQEQLRRILDAHARSLAHAARIGVRIVAGSDAGSQGVPHGHGFLRELELMESAGLSAVQVLHAATGAPAARLQFAEDFGVLRRAAKARFLITPASVLQSVSHLRVAAIVVFDGTAHAGGDNPAEPGL